jgi:hypothetical protein
MKPANMPCEVIFNGSSFELDAKNANCSALASAISLNNGAIRKTRAANDWEELRVGADGKGVLRGKSPALDWEIPIAPGSIPGDYQPGPIGILPPGSLPENPPLPDAGTGAGTGTGTVTGPSPSTTPSSSSWLCGIAGLPPCNVSIDQTDVPTSVDALSSPKTLVDEIYRPLDSKVGNPDGIWPAFTVINWNFSLPTYCSVISIPAFSPVLDSIDICKYQPIFHSIMSVIWIIGGLFGSIGLFWRNVMATN